MGNDWERVWKMTGKECSKREVGKGRDLKRVRGREEGRERWRGRERPETEKVRKERWSSTLESYLLMTCWYSCYELTMFFHPNWAFRRDG